MNTSITTDFFASIPAEVTENMREILALVNASYDFDTMLKNESSHITRFSELEEDVAMPEITYRSSALRKMEKQVDQLDTRLKKILDWRNGKDKSACRRRNIAKCLGISPKTVYKLEQQALKNLRGGK